MSTVDHTRHTNEALSRAQWELTPIPSFLWQADRGQFTLIDVNPAAENLARKTGRELLGMTADDFYHERQDFHIKLQTCLEQESVIKYATTLSTYTAKQDRTVEFTFAYVPPDLILVLADDAQCIRDTQHKLERAQRVAQMGSWEWDYANQEQVWANGLYDILGIGADFKLTRADLDAMIRPEDRSWYRTRVLEAQATGKPVRFDARILGPDGEVKTVAHNIEISRKDDGAPHRMFAVMQDISERKRVEDQHSRAQVQLAQAHEMESIGRLAGGMAHDLNNILTAIMLPTELAQQMVEPGTKLHKNLSSVHAAAQRAAGIIHQLLGFARRQPTSPKVLDMNRVIQGMLPMLTTLVGEKIDLVWQPHNTLWQIEMDPSQIEQILTNLCASAHDVMKGTGTITIATANAILAEPDGDIGGILHEYVLLSVADTRPPIDPNLVDHLFEPYYFTMGGGKATGLSLAAVDGIVSQNRGKVHVDRVPRDGTTISIYVPRCKETDAGHAIQQKQVDLRGNGRSVLLVDDDATIREWLTTILSNLGFDVIAAESPSTALRQAKNSTVAIDVLVTDVIMPEMSGIVLAKHIAEIQPHIRTLYMSGYPADVLVGRNLLEVDAQFLVKPFSLDELAAKLNETFGLPS